MAYKILSSIQSVVIAICGVSVLDFGLGLGVTEDLSFGLNEFMFGDSNTAWWSTITFWAYLFFIVALLQMIKVFTVKMD